MTRVRRNTSKIEVIAHKTEIDDLLHKGLPYMSVFKKLKAENKITCKYHAFLKSIRLICENKTTDQRTNTSKQYFLAPNNTADNQPTEKKQKSLIKSPVSSNNISEILKNNEDISTLLGNLEDKDNYKENN